MKKTLTFILIFSFLFFFGCASNRTKVSKMDNDFIRDISKQTDISVGFIFQYSHYGSTWRRGGPWWSTLFYSFTSEEKEYAHYLGRKSCEVIEEVINETASFHLKSGVFKHIPRLFEVEALAQDEWEEQRLRNKNQEAMVQFLESNSLTGALFVKASYRVSPGWKKKVVLSTWWTMYGRDGDVTAKITTYYQADKAEEIFPNTLDPRYEETFLKLTKISAENFIKLLFPRPTEKIVIETEPAEGLRPEHTQIEESASPLSEQEKEKQKWAYVIESQSVTKVSLRTEPNKVSDSYLRTTLPKYNLHDASLNPRGSFDNHFVDNGDGTITDISTGLMWEKSGSSGMTSRGRAQTYVNKLNEDMFAGHSDWRLPTMDELASLLERDKKDGLHIDPVFDPKQKKCWSSDRADHTGQASEYWWLVDFGKGRGTRAHISWLQVHNRFEKNYVRAVRSIK